MSDTVDSVFSAPIQNRNAPASIVGSRCVHCNNESWARVIREALEGMLAGRIPIYLTVRDLYDRMVVMSDEDREKIGLIKYRYADGRVPPLNTMRNHIQTHERELWLRVKQRKADAGCSW